MDSCKWWTPNVRQTWCVSGVLICIVGQGMMMGHTGCLLPALQAPDSPIKIDIDSASWLASAMGPALLIGIAMGCVLMDWLGRRKAFLIVIIPGFTGWLMMYFAQNYTVLFIGRVLTGATAGGSNAVGVIMIGECTSPENRGMFLNLKTAGVCIGSALVHILGNFMHWRTITIVALVPHVIAFFVTCTWPESPAWLATRKRYDKCKQDFLWFRGTDERSLHEVTEMIDQQKERFSRPIKKFSVIGKLLDFFQRFTKKDFLKPLFIIFISHILMEVSGRHYFATYALQIMSDIVKSKTMPYYYTFSVDAIVIFSTIASSVLVRVMNRRTLLFSTGIAALAVLTGMCVYLYLMSIGVLSTDYPLIITFIFIIYFCLINLGCAPISLALQGELFPLIHREAASTVSGVYMSLNLMAIVKVTPYLIEATQIYGMFAIFGTIAAVTLVILYFILPETKDRTLQEIEYYFNNGEFRNEEIRDYDVHLKMFTEDET